MTGLVRGRPVPPAGRVRDNLMPRGSLTGDASQGKANPSGHSVHYYHIKRDLSGTAEDRLLCRVQDPILPLPADTAEKDMPLDTKKGETYFFIRRRNSFIRR